MHSHVNRTKSANKKIKKENYSERKYADAGMC